MDTVLAVLGFGAAAGFAAALAGVGVAKLKGGVWTVIDREVFGLPVMMRFSDGRTPVSE